MNHIKTWLAVSIFLICMPAFADDTTNMNDPFLGVVAAYRAANPKPQLSEEARKFKVQAEFAVQNKEFDKAAELYGKALDIAPWWPAGHFNRALILGEIKKYRVAMNEMKRYLLLVPDAPDARAAQDKIYQWESLARPEPTMVRIPGKNYEIGKYDVTQAEWKAVMGNNPSKFSLCGDTCPVEQVSWDDVQVFIQKLNAETGKQYRLPTETEWEYACYGGSQTEYCGGNDIDAVAWHDEQFGNGNSNGTTHPAGQKQANSYGLYDMSGNVWQWTSDCWEGDCAQRVLRGGSWFNIPQHVRASFRIHNDHTLGDQWNGFRLARTLP
jgi:formylglycine-generating enzyme required for sulfatase activity